ncbi:MAG: amino acid permease [Candidatus Koribacter versatilis]|uniref:Amino acid permease n=1 Tax=Candidatus Korobacter versatilis TaxID=658062 RepID=A0A932EPH7_9BACT|nr:amino acid permease [Candidatus Koribacter versatilis]
MSSQLFRKKSIDKLIAESEEPERRLQKTLGPWSLTALGIGAVIGSGIFTVIGTAMAGQKFTAESVLYAPLLEYLIHRSPTFGRPGAGPAIALSFVLVAVVCAFAALCYAELASMIPIAGSAYTYTYATMGELIAWIIGWDLILEYAVSNMAVSVGFSEHLVNLLDFFHIHLPAAWMFPAYLPSGSSLFQPGWHFGFNLPAFLVVMALTVVLVRGIRESASTNNIMVVLKIVAILVFVGFTAHLIDPQKYRPFMPNGWPGVLTGGAIIFFTYIGFDSVSTAAEEAKDPQRDVPIGIIATLVTCTILYVAVVLVYCGVEYWNSPISNSAAPVVNLLATLNKPWVRIIVLSGAMLGMISSLLVFQLGQARVWFAMSRDGLLPRMFSHVHPKFRTPDVATWIAGFVVGIPAGLFDIGTFADLSNIGTLFAFALVAGGVLIMRYKDPHRKRGFRAPGGPIVPILAIVFCVLLMAGLPILNWLRFFAWLGIGLVIYFFYGRHRSEFSSAKLPAARRP